VRAGALGDPDAVGAVLAPSGEGEGEGENVTANRGASETRAAIQDKIRRMLRDGKYDCACGAELRRLSEWIDLQAQRAGHKPGGLGKKLIRPTIKTRPTPKPPEQLQGKHFGHWYATDGPKTRPAVKRKAA
jgi:hypothetical protein